MKKLAIALICTMTLVPLLSSRVSADQTQPPAPPKVDKKIQAVLDRFDAFQEGTKTLKGTFRQENLSALLAEPAVLDGTVILERPSKVRYEYGEPSPLTFVISEGTLTAHDPQRKLACRLDVRRYEKKVFKYMGLTEPMAELLQHFKPSLEEAQTEGCDRLVLTSSSRKTRDKLASLVFELDKTSGAPKRLEIVQKDGDMVTFQFTKLEVNVELEDGVFSLSLPRGTRITDDILELLDPVRN